MSREDGLFCLSLLADIAHGASLQLDITCTDAERYNAVKSSVTFYASHSQ